MDEATDDEAGGGQGERPARSRRRRGSRGGQRVRGGAGADNDSPTPDDDTEGFEVPGGFQPTLPREFWDWPTIGGPWR
jgi:hypothetical protein